MQNNNNDMLCRTHKRAHFDALKDLKKLPSVDRTKVVALTSNKKVLGRIKNEIFHRINLQLTMLISLATDTARGDDKCAMKFLTSSLNYALIMGRSDSFSSKSY